MDLVRIFLGRDLGVERLDGIRRPAVGISHNVRR